MPEPLSPPPAPRPRYQALPGRLPTLRWQRTRSVVNAELWLGDEFVLTTERVFYQEHYQRFYYADIQALILQRTWRGAAYNWIGAALAVLFGIGAFLVGEVPGEAFLAGIAAFWLVMVLVNALRGQTCRCHLQTALGPRVLPTLHRRRAARWAFRLIAERVEVVQGALAPEDAARRMDQFIAQHAPAQSGFSRPAPAPKDTY